MEEAVARVALSYEACQLAETAGAAVPTSVEELAAARAVLQAVDRYVESVVALARLRGSSWQEIAAALGRSGVSRRDECIPAVRVRTAGVKGEEAASPPAACGAGIAPEARSWWREHLAADPTEAALDLDDWVRRHLDEDAGPAPVSGVLRRQATV